MMRFVRRTRGLRQLGMALLAMVLITGVPVAVAGVSVGRVAGAGATVDLPDRLLVAQGPALAP